MVGMRYMGYAPLKARKNEGRAQDGNKISVSAGGTLKLIAADI